nr:chemotaxis protein CheB [Adhaeribacter aquaticus]
MLLTGEAVRVTKEPRENTFRPSIDTLFRWAAADFNSVVIGVVLSGMRDDGVEGLNAMGRSGGITVVQDPENAPYPEMPQAVLAHMPVGYKVSRLVAQQVLVYV